MSQDRLTAVVTGASHGIGRVVAARLAQDGFHVIAAARSLSQLEELAEETGVQALKLDVTDEHAVNGAMRRVEQEFGAIDLLVNNAGVAGDPGETWRHTPAAWWRVFEVNVLGTFLCSRAVLLGMTARRGGRVVNVSSGAGLFRVPSDLDAVLNSAYMASKAAVIRFSEALAAEAAVHGVSVFAISPGTVRTAMTAGRFTEKFDSEDLWSPPELSADLIAFIASGALDALSGRYIHAEDDWRLLPDRSQEVLARDLHAMRLRSDD